MKRYKKAESVLPKELLDEIQKYVQGEYLYIPTSSGVRKAWGEKSGARRELVARNQAIRKAYSSGESVETLADRYYLSMSSIKKIIYSK